MAKPIIDIAVAAENFQDILAHQEALKAEGFFYRPNAQTSICDQLLLACGSYYQGTGEMQTHFIHVVLQDSQAWEDYIRFRDYLNGHPEAARAYEALKLSLAREAPVDPGREKYLEGKRAFIQDILERARDGGARAGAGLTRARPNSAKRRNRGGRFAAAAKRPPLEKTARHGTHRLSPKMLEKGKRYSRTLNSRLP